MMEEHRKLAIAEEMERAGQANRAAWILAENRLYNDAISRLSLALHFHIRALLISIDREPRNEEAALKLFCRHFVKTAQFPHEAACLFSKMVKFREEADYNPACLWEETEITDLVPQVGNVCQKIVARLKTEGLY